MSFRILYFTDSHFRETNPRGRKDNFLQSLIEKHMEIAKMSQALKPDLIVHGGDLFDAPKQSIYLYQIVKKIIQASYVPWHVVLGNHEWRGSWDDWKVRSALNALEEGGQITLHEGHFKHQVFGNVIISRHEQYVKRPVPWHHHLWKDYDGSADIFLVSDYHPFQGTATINGTTFVGPGAISRGTRTESDLTRTPKVAYITLELNEEPKIKYFKLKSAKPGGEVFHEDLAKAPQNLTNFQTAIDNLKALKDEIKLYSVEDVVKVVAATTKVSQEVTEACLARLSETSSKS